MITARPLNIGITCYPGIGGSGILATTLGIALARRGHDVHFISYEKPFRLTEHAPRITFHPVTISGYGLFKYPDYTLPLSVKMAEVSRCHRLDILHVHYAVPHATAAILARCMLRSNHRPRVVTTLHGTDITLLGSDPGYGPAILHALNQSDAITTVSHDLRSETRRLLGFEGAIRVIHNFFKPAPPVRSRDEVRRELGLGDDVMILHASNLRPCKRIDLLLETIARVHTRKAFKLVILAGTSFVPFMSEVRRLGIEDRIVVRENVLDIEDYLQATDVGLITSENESFCLSLLEAMYFGCPSVATRVGGIPEVIENEVSGLLVPFGDVDPLARAVERMIDKADLRARLGQAAKKRAETAFSQKVIVPRYEALYRSLLWRTRMSTADADRLVHAM